MKYLGILLVSVIVLLSCRSTKQEKNSETYSSSGKEMYSARYESLLRELRDSLINVKAPAEKSTSKGLQRSELETSLARSTAFVDSAGMLNHWIENKDTIPSKMIFNNINHYIHDTIYVNKTDTLRIKVTEWKEKGLSFWTKVQMTAGNISFGLLLVIGAIWGIRKYMKK